MRQLASGFFALMLFFHSTPVWACPECRVQVQSGFYNKDFNDNLFILLLPIIVLLLIGVGIYFADSIKSKVRGRVSQWRTTYNAHH
jgi:hypothetical protein